MMNKTHIAGGLLAGSATLLFLQPHIPQLNYIGTAAATGFTLTTTASFSALLPDIDHKHSRIGRKLWFLAWPIYVLQFFSKILGIFSSKKYKIMRKYIGHRGFTHFPSTWLVLTGFSILISYFIYLLELHAILAGAIYGILAGFSIGLLSHIILDFFSGKIKLFAPISLKSYGIPIFKSNGFLEDILRSVLYLTAIYFLYLYGKNIWMHVK